MLEAALAFVLNLVRDHGPPILFLAALIENALFLSWALPGELLLALGGYMIQQGQLRAEVAWLSVWLGVLVGDHIAYLVGRFGGRRLLQRLPFSNAFVEVERLIEKYGGLVVLFGRFSGGLRPAILLCVGTLGLPYRSFWPYELLGAAAWSAWWLALGAIGGVLVEQFGDIGPLRQGIWLATIVVATFIALRYRKRLLARLMARPEGV